MPQPTPQVMANAQPAQPGLLEQIIPPDSMLGKMFDGSPDSQMALMQLGQSMMQPQQPGTGFGQNLIGSLGDAVNYLGALEATRNQQSMEERELAAQNALREDQGTALTARADSYERQGDQTDMANAIDLFKAKNEREKSQMVFEAAMRKTDSAADDRKKVLLEGLMNIMEAKMVNDGQFDFEQMMTMSNMVEAGWNPTFDDFRAVDGELWMNRKMMDEPDSETLERKDNYMRVDAETVAALGIDPKKVIAHSAQALQREQSKSVSDKSRELDPDLEPTLPGTTSETARASELPARDLTDEAPLAISDKQAELETRVLEARQRQEDKKRNKEFIKESRKAINLHGGANVEGNKELVQKEFRSNFAGLEPWQREVWLNNFRSYLSADDIAKAEALISGVE